MLSPRQAKILAPLIYLLSFRPAVVPIIDLNDPSRNDGVMRSISCDVGSYYAHAYCFFIISGSQSTGSKLIPLGI